MFMIGCFLLLFSELDDVAGEVVGRGHFDADFHQVVAGIGLVVAGEPALPAGHEADFFHAIAGGWVEALQARAWEALAVARVNVVGKDNAVGLAIADALNDAMLPLIRRDEAIEIGRPDDVPEALVLLDCLAAILAVVSGETFQADVEAQFPLEGDVNTELDARPSVPFRDVSAHGFGGHELRVAPLDEEPLDGVCIVAAPELGEVAQPRDVGASAASRAHHHVEVGVLGLNAVENSVEPPHVIDIQVALIFPEERGIDVGDG